MFVIRKQYGNFVYMRNFIQDFRTMFENIFTQVLKLLYLVIVNLAANYVCPFISKSIVKVNLGSFNFKLIEMTLSAYCVRENTARHILPASKKEPSHLQ